MQKARNRMLQGSAKRPLPGLVNFVPAVACLFCLNLPAAFSQPGNDLIVLYSSVSHHVVARPRKHPDVPSLRVKINDGPDKAARPGARGQRSRGHHHLRFSLQGSTTPFPGTKKDTGSAIRPFFCCHIAGESCSLRFILKPQWFQ